MNGKYLLDTNIVIALFAKDENVSRKVAEADGVFASSIVVGSCFSALSNQAVSKLTFSAPKISPQRPSL